MKILITPYNWLPNNAAGGEWYLYHLCKGLMSLGHQVKAITNTAEQYTYQGIELHPQGSMETMWNNNNEVCKWADVIFMQLLGNAYGYNKAFQHKKKLILFCHNPSRHYFVNPQTAVVYNSYALGNIYPDNKSTVLQPLIPDAKPSKGTKIALINCNENKGGSLFVQLAESMPDYEFVGIKGMYGDQITADLTNLTYRNNSPKMNWNDVGLLLVPSAVESWSQSATEAIMRDIPVISSDLPGLRENLSYAGIYIKENNVNLYRLAIIGLDRKSQIELCRKRAKELDTAPRLLEFEKWLIDFVKN